MEIYLDNSATTRVLPQVAELMTKIMCEDYGNPSSMHMKGVEAERVIKDATESLAKILKVTPKEIIYTSGGTESDNLALIGCARANCRTGKHIITSCVEHPAVLNTCKYLEKEGFTVTYLPVDKSGRVRLADLEMAITDETILVSIMHTNNEIGARQPLEEIGALIKKKNPNCLFHVDAVQGFGKAVILPKKMKIDLLSVSSHKIHGPKGVGFLYVGEKVKINPILFGGGQQNNMRSGTDNVPGIAGMALAAQTLYSQLAEDEAKLYELKTHFIERVTTELENVRVNGLPGGGLDSGINELSEEVKAGIHETAPHVVSVSFKGVRAEVLLHALESEGIYSSAGSACSTHKPMPSATLQAIGLEKELLTSTLRFSFSIFTTMEEIDTCVEVLKKQLPMLRKFTRR